ncbi:glycerophosphodiester phosphodiesterase [Kaustia mangrovi]|uniref:Glycerophosphodiester phosphodiesterase n=1 Tax=Kaustia mangrovi TaxID=2593653 RepID=A0A7S8C1H1_9HYPH|nr:glycerophosphodiester phosphodiesterase family protein [Kaustia mangrovi]QPC41627.1 glycerophosphodiester phosphodiesterase [Kaustia mangrovi]
MRWTPDGRALSWLTERPVTHRGLHDRSRGVLENTASAVTAALKGGYGIEVDLQLAGDGEAVVFHDATLDRLTGETGPLLARPSRDLARIPLRGTRDRIMTLGELFGLVSGRAPLFLELKSLWDGSGRLERRVAALLAAYDGPVAVMSFDPDMIANLRLLSPATVRGLVACRDCGAGEDAHLSLARRLGLRHMTGFDEARPQFLAYDVHGLPSAPSRAFRALGRPILSWTVRTPGDAARARRYADQIIFETIRPPSAI